MYIAPPHLEQKFENLYKDQSGKNKETISSHDWSMESISLDFAISDNIPQNEYQDPEIRKMRINQLHKFFNFVDDKSNRLRLLMNGSTEVFKTTVPAVLKGKFSFIHQFFAFYFILTIYT